ncbi:F-box domain-containing protein [Pleurotus pulmonarius]
MENMGQAHGIDNDEQLFDFDPYEGSSTSPNSGPTPVLGERAAADAVWGVSELEWCAEKGKGSTSIPMPARSAAVEYDVFDAAPDDATKRSHDVPSSSLSPPSGSRSHSASVEHVPTEQHGTYSDSEVVGTSKGKGKEREQPPTLPPLDFTPTELGGYDASNWPSTSFSPSSPGPSSYGSGYASLNATTQAVEQLPSIITTIQPSVSAVASDAPVLTRMPSRRRSLSHIPTHPPHSEMARPMSGVRLRLGSPKPTGSLARKLFKKRDEAASPVTRTSQIIDSDGVHSGQGNCFIPWYGDFKPSPNSQIISSLNNNLELAIDLDQQKLPLYHTTPRAKTRSNSSPYPISALDLVVPSSDDIFAPIPLIIRNYFDEALPRELKLYIFQALVHLHEEDYSKALRDGTWSMMKASSSKGRWLGRDRGARELVKFSRVSRSWQSITLDGQLWVDLDLKAFPAMPTSLIKRLAETGGRFIRSVDLAGNSHISSLALSTLADSLCLDPTPSSPLAYTQLTTINLQGCSALEKPSLHHLLMCSPSLQKLVLKGLRAVTNMTLEILGVYCRRLTFLDVSRCTNMDAEGVRSMAKGFDMRGDHLLLKTLRLSGLKYATDSMMAVLGRAAPFLEVLDLSYARQLHNSALEAFVACNDDDTEEELGVKIVTLTAREIGRESTDYNKCRRRVTRLRHLCLSSCILLTDTACANLAHSVPKLEFLELAGICTSLKDDGLVTLLNTTPLIRRLDVEDAVELTDSFLAAITPASPEARASAAPSAPVVQTGQMLEHLIISSASEMSNAALAAVVRNCTRLRVLEADATNISSNVVKEFVRLSQKRNMINAKVVAVDCRAVSESTVRSLTQFTRPRLGWRAHEARRLRFLDARDTRDGVTEELKIGQDECDERRVVIKTFYSWQTVDAVRADREKRRKRQARRTANESGGSFVTDEEDGNLGDATSRTLRWWSPNGTRRGFSSAGPNSPLIGDMANDGCRLM